MQLQFSLQTLIRPTAEGISLHGASGQAYLCQSPQLLAWLGQFHRTTDLHAAMANMPPEQKQFVMELVERLIQLGVLVHLQTQQPSTALSSNEKNQQLLKQMARSVYDLSADVQGFGDDAEHLLPGLALHQRLFAIAGAIHELRANLGDLRSDYLQNQLQRMRLDIQPLRVHLGAGGIELEGFINIDIAPAPLAMNVLWGLPFADHSCELVYASHLLEHLYFPHDVHQLLCDIERVLRPGGLVRIVVPDMGACLQAYADHDETFFASRRENFSWWPEQATMLENFLTYAGVGCDPSHSFEGHKYGYDFPTLAKALQQAGFTEIGQSSYQGSAHPALHVEDQSSTASWQSNGRYLSLFVEARKALA